MRVAGVRFLRAALIGWMRSSIGNCSFQQLIIYGVGSCMHIRDSYEECVQKEGPISLFIQCISTLILKLFSLKAKNYLQERR